MGRLFQMVKGVLGGFRIRPAAADLHPLADEAVFRPFREDVYKRQGWLRRTGKGLEPV